MFRLTRQVRFAVNATADEQLSARPANRYAGYPSLTGLGHFFALSVTVRGEVDLATSYLINIRRIDETVRALVIPLVCRRIESDRFAGGGEVLLDIFASLHAALDEISLDSVAINLSPFLSLSCFASEHPMIRLSQKFEFSASHRLHSPDLSDDENRRRFGKCNNPNGHGHNYELQVTLRGEPDANGRITDIPRFERVVADTVVERFDHKNLNVEVPEFRDVIPTVENIARTIHGLLKSKLGASLASVTVWETPKTWCEYSE
ncbi:MAG: 6-pyruvoyl trahydropterin synthase family protein [Tepidisphaeraceae bacterium]